VELAEVKPAILEYGTVGGLIEGQFQLRNYIDKAKSDENRRWRGLRRIDEFVEMPPTRIAWPTSLDTSRGQKIAVGWCLPGLVGYRPLSAEEAETIVCGTTDKGTIDKFLNSALDKAEGIVDQFIDKSMDPAITTKLEAVTLRDGLRSVAPFIPGFLFPGIEYMPEELRAEYIENFIENVLGLDANAYLRRLAIHIKTELLSAARQRIKDALRKYLQETLTALCAAAAVGATVSIAQLLKKLGQDFGKMFADAVAAIVKGWVDEVAKEFAKAVVYILIAALAVALIVVLLPEILAALAVAAEVVVAGIVALGAAAAVLATELQGQLEGFLDTLFAKAASL
jgi:hypothetical protein